MTKQYKVEIKLEGPSYEGTEWAEWHFFGEYDTYNMAHYIAGEVIYETTERVRIVDKESSIVLFENKDHK